MIYEFNCEACDSVFEVNVPVSDNQKPLSEPCPLCSVKGKVFRVFGASAILQHERDGVRAKQAGSEWNSVLKKIDKAAGPKSTIFKNDPYSQSKIGK